MRVRAWDGGADGSACGNAVISRFDFHGCLLVWLAGKGFGKGKIWVSERFWPGFLGQIVLSISFNV